MVSEVTSSIGIGQVGKSPHVSDPDGQSHTRKNKLPLGTPLSSFYLFGLIISNLVIDAGLDVGHWSVPVQLNWNEIVD